MCFFHPLALTISVQKHELCSIGARLLLSTGQLQKPKIHVQISAVNVDLVCQMEHLPSGTNIGCNLYIGDSFQPFLSSWTKSQSVCYFVVKLDDLQQGPQSVGATEVSCDYSVPTDPRSPSPRSDKIKIEGLSPEPSTFSEADKKTTSPPHVTTKKKKKKPPTPPPLTVSTTEPRTVPPMVPTTEPKSVRFLWRHILSALVLLVAIGILIEHFISHTPTTDAAGRGE